MAAFFIIRTMDYLYKKYLSSTGINTDTRLIVKGNMFFALKGDNFDGNQYASQALENGAEFVVVDNLLYCGENDDRYIFVDDVLITLQKLASFHRGKLDIPVIGITGSNGKTTTKELIYAVLSTNYCVCATVGNYNNHIGVPLTILSIDARHEIAIVEMGTNNPGEIEELCKISAPTHGLITNIGKAHLEGFGNTNGVSNEKRELYKYLAIHDGHIFINKEDQKLSSILPNKVKHTNVNEIVLELVPSFPYIILKTENESLVKMQITGRYNIGNILYAIAIGRYFEVSNIDIYRSLNQYKPTNNRSQVKEIDSNIYVLDCYNANPSSMRLSIENLLLEKSNKRVLILGDMKELGITEHEEHSKVMMFVSEHKWRSVFTVGDTFYNCEHNRYKKFKSTKGLSEYLVGHPIQNATVLLKGSRSVGLEKLLYLK